ncbi:MAG: patatin-like phospholipase family protein, partial [Acidimicrobiales bacterium]
AVLAALNAELGWDARAATVIVGTSAGAVAGASLRAGLAPPDMLARTEGRPLSPAGQQLIQRAGITSPPTFLRPERGGRRRPDAASVAKAAAGALRARPAALLATLIPEGTVSTDLITAGVEGLMGDRWPENPLLLCAVDIANGRRVVFGAEEPRPPLGRAVAASCAIPGFFEPVTIGERRYVDGGAHSPTNADILRDHDLDFVLVSSPMSIAGRTPRLAADEPMRRWARTLLATKVLALRRRKLPVLTFQPTPDDASVMGLNAMDPNRRSAVASQVSESVTRRLRESDSVRKLRESIRGDR